MECFHEMLECVLNLQNLQQYVNYKLHCVIMITVFYYLFTVRDLFHVFSTVLITKGAGTRGVELYLQHQLSELLITEERGLPVLLHVTDFVLCSDV